jgi:hypothetical protein
MGKVFGKGGKPHQLDEVPREIAALGRPHAVDLERNSTLPMTVRHGSRPKFWNTMQASLRGLVTGVPAM